MLITNPVVMIFLIWAEAVCPLLVKQEKSWRVDTVALVKEDGIRCFGEAGLVITPICLLFQPPNTTSFSKSSDIPFKFNECYVGHHSVLDFMYDLDSL